MLRACGNSFMRTKCCQKGFATFPRNKNAALPIRAQKSPLTLSGLKKWVPDDTFGHELSRPKRVSWLPAYGMRSATSIPVSCDGVKTYVFMDDSIGLSGGQMGLRC
jgi:hypothetical protein